MDWGVEFWLPAEHLLFDREKPWKLLDRVGLSADALCLLHALQGSWGPRM